jgi:hypothetical protein
MREKIGLCGLGFMTYCRRKKIATSAMGQCAIERRVQGGTVRASQ